MFGNGDGDEYTWEIQTQTGWDIPNLDGHPDETWYDDKHLNLTDAEDKLLGDEYSHQSQTLDRIKSLLGSHIAEAKQKPIPYIFY